jgi:hypothetical protein
MPFTFGEQWGCSQGPGGTYSHTGSLSQAYDLNINGNEDFADPVRSPVEGTVVAVFKNAQNNCKGEGWGNYVIIKASTEEKYIRMAHLQYGSVAVNPNDQVWVGKYIGNVGCTGFAEGPHLHIQVQDQQGGASVPFRFVEGAITCNTNSSVGHFSQLLTKASLIDNKGDLNLGHRLTGNVTMFHNDAWMTSTGAPGYVGSNYLVQQVNSYDLPWFSWAFRVKQSGWYSVYANWVAHPNRDTCAKYIVRWDGTPIYSTACINQTVGNGRVNFKLIAASVYLYAGYTYEVEVQGMTPGKYLVADAIVIAGGP